MVEGIGEHYGSLKRRIPSPRSPDWHDHDDERTLVKYGYADPPVKLPDGKRQPNRLLVALGHDDAVETALYLCRSGVATKAFLGHATADPYVEVWTCDRWEPWSVVTATI